MSETKIRPKRHAKDNKNDDFEYDTGHMAELCDCNICSRVQDLHVDTKVDYTTVQSAESGRYTRIPCDVIIKVKPDETIQSLQNYLHASGQPHTWDDINKGKILRMKNSVAISIYNNGTFMVQMNHECINWMLDIWPQVQEQTCVMSVECQSISPTPPENNSEVTSENNSEDLETTLEDNVEESHPFSDTDSETDTIREIFDD